MQGALREKIVRKCDPTTNPILGSLGQSIHNTVFSLWLFFYVYAHTYNVRVCVCVWWMKTSNIKYYSLKYEQLSS